MWTVWKQTQYRNDRCAAFHQMIYLTVGNHAQPIPQNSPLCSFTLWSRSLTWEASEHIRQAELNIDMSKWIMNVLQSKKWKCNSYQIKMDFFFLFFWYRQGMWYSLGMEVRHMEKKMGKVKSLHLWRSQLSNTYNDLLLQNSTQLVLQKLNIFLKEL